MASLIRSITYLWTSWMMSWWWRGGGTRTPGWSTRGPKMPSHFLMMLTYMIYHDSFWYAMIFLMCHDALFIMSWLPYANIAKFCPQDEASLSDNDESGVDVRIFFSTLEIFSDVFWMLEIPDKANMRCYRLFYVWFNQFIDDLTFWKPILFSQKKNTPKYSKDLEILCIFYKTSKPSVFGQA